MAFTVTARHTGDGGTVTAQTQTTSSTTPAASSLLLTFFGVQTDSTGVQPSFQTPTGGSLTYAQVDKYGDVTMVTWNGDAAFPMGAAMYQAPVGGSPSAFAVTVDGYSGTTVGWYQTVCCDITGHDTTTPVVQHKGDGLTKGAGNSETGSVTLTSTPTVGNLVVVGFFAAADTGGAFTDPTIGGQAMTAIVAQNNSGFDHSGLWYRVWTGAESSAVITCSDLGDSVGGYAAVAVEIAAAAGGGGATRSPLAGIRRSAIVRASTY